MTLYKIFWDEEYNGNCHDEFLAGPLPKDEAFNFANDWAERRVLAAFPTVSNEDELFGKMVDAKKLELSFEAVEIPEEKLDKVELKVNNILMNAFSNGADNLKDMANEALANHFGDEAYCKKEIQSVQSLRRAMKDAKENGLTKITLIFEKED